ncbi:hypothetical protein VLK31_23870 [Variovorax sp. H27-G14]|uniref:hypothetical protein n=1 Tax=Variovorax sp. H27-G14 TaxID=3111914 RepID=UPI0038FCFEA9
MAATELASLRNWMMSKDPASVDRVFMRSSPGIWVPYLLVACFSLWLRQGFPVYAIGPATFDDALFVRTARHLADGQWLGPYDNLTLAKGMFYSLFINVSSTLGVGLKMGEHLVYLMVALFAAMAVGQRARSRPLAVVLFTALALNPVLWHPELARVIREGLYLSLSFATLLLFYALQAPIAGLRLSRMRALAMSTAAGLTLGAFWMTREEGIWIVPALVVIVALGMLGQLQRSAEAQGRFVRFPTTDVRSLLRLLLPAAGAVMVAGAVVAAVKACNFAEYGVSVSTEFQENGFKRAYGALARIHQDAPRRYVVFPADARARAYAASPTASELKPFLDGDNGNMWRQVGCTQLAVTECPEILSGWFMWAFRDAVSLAGHYRTAPEAAAFYERLADEVNAACDAGRIPCGASRSTLAPIFRWGYVEPTLDAAWLLTKQMFGLGDGLIGVSASAGTQQQLTQFKNMVGRVSLPADERYEITGWVSASDIVPTLAVQSVAGAAQPSSLTLGPAPDVEVAFPDRAARRFRLRTSCPVPACRLQALVAGRDAAGDVHLGLVIDSDAIKVYVEGVSDAYTTRPERIRQQEQKIASRIAAAYRVIWPWLSAVALIGVLWAAVAWWRWPRVDFLLALALACLAGVASRILMLAYLEATSIPSVNVLYASPASPMVICFTVIGLYLGLTQMRVHTKK